MDALTFLILSLAVWRVCRMFVAEEGPFGIFDTLRHRLKVAKQETWIQRGLGCLACVSFWVSLPAAWVFSSSPYLLRPVEAMAISAVCVILLRKVG